MAYNYEEDLNRLKEAQKQAAIAGLDKQKNEALSGLQKEEEALKPMYYEKRNTANVQNQLNAKNFHEYLINSGRSNSGIGAQFEMTNRNRLASDLGALNRQETAALGDINRRRTDVGNAYQSGLAGANAQIEANYIQNLLNERQKEWQRQMQERQLAEQQRQFNMQMAMRNSGGGRSSGGSRRSYSSRGRKEEAKEPEISNFAKNMVKFYGTRAQGFQKTPKALAATLKYSYEKGQINSTDVRYLSRLWGLE